jgi:hypothetical protein
MIRRRDTDRLDVICRAFETIFDAHDAKLKAASDSYAKLETSEERYCDALIALMKVPAIRQAITPELRQMLAPLIDPDDFEEYT